MVGMRPHIADEILAAAALAAVFALPVRPGVFALPVRPGAGG